MRKLLLIAMLLFCISCGTGDDDYNGSSCGSYNGHALYVGPKGGCYYYNSNGNKTYVDRSYCNCN